MPEIANRLVVGLLNKMGTLVLKSGMHRLVVRPHLLLEMCLKVLGILVKHGLADHLVLLKIAVVRPRFRCKVELSLAIMNRTRVFRVSWQVWRVANKTLLNGRGYCRK